MYSKVRKSLLLMPIDCEDKDFALVEENLYLGNKELANNYHSMNKFDISLVIAVYPKSLIGPSVQSRSPNCRFHHIDVKDAPHEDLISHFDKCYNLITQELNQNEGKVLVYCGAGYSRSVTIVCAYLMKKYRISAEEAVERVRHVRNRINPNKGFLLQLAVYEDMEYELDPTHHFYRFLALIALKRQVWTTEYWEDSRVGRLNRWFCDPIRMYFEKLSKFQNKSLIHKSKIYYKCFECETVLFEVLNILTNINNRDQIEDTVVCDKLFVEPIKWMLPSICVKRKSDLLCPNCSITLGAFKWKSFKCECRLHDQLEDSALAKIDKSAVVKYVN